MANSTEALIKKAIRGAVQKAVVEVMGRLRRKIERAEAIDGIIENVIPRRYSGLARDKMKSRIRENLRKNNVL